MNMFLQVVDEVDEHMQFDEGSAQLNDHTTVELISLNPPHARRALGVCFLVPPPFSPWILGAWDVDRGRCIDRLHAGTDHGRV